VIEGEAVVLRPIAREVALALLEGLQPSGVVFAEGYPSRFSLEVMDILAGPRAATTDGRGFAPCFVVRKADGRLAEIVTCEVVESMR
jgi:hypothetical protein